jgi:integrase
MARRSYQSPRPKLVGKRWEIVIREPVADISGVVRRRQRRITLGYRDDITTQAQAAALAEPILAKINSGAHVYRISFQALVERWKESVIVEQSPSSQSSARSVICRWLVPYWGSSWLSSVTPESVQAYIANLRRKDVSPKTVWNIVTVMRSIWRSALDWGYATDPIFDRVKIRRPDESEARSFTLEQVRIIIQSAPEPYSTFYWLAAETGMRGGELCALRWPDIDLDAGMVTARRSVWRGRFKDTKTRRIRRLAISEQLRERLVAMARLRHPRADLVFHSRNLTPWDLNLVQKRKLRPILRTLGITSGGLHGFRHFSGSAIIGMGAPASVARDRLGHASLTMTSRYAHSATQDDRLAASRLGAAIGTSHLGNRIWRVGPKAISRN